MKDSAGPELVKIEKLLEKIEKDIKKHQDKEIYRESEKYVQHVQKTVELYCLALDEVLGSTGLSALPRHCNVLKKMFNGMQGQLKSILKFGLYHIKQNHSKLAQQQHQDDDYMLTIASDGNGQIASYNAFDSRGSPTNSNSPQPFAGRSSRPHITINVQSGGLYSGPNPNITSQSMITFRNSLNNKSPTSSSYNRDFVVPGSAAYGGFMAERGDGSLNQVPGEEEDGELHEYMLQHEKMKEEIDDILKGKNFIEHIGPSRVSTNLKQILRGLEYTTKKVDQLTVAPEDDDDLDEPNFAALGKKINKAFGQAKVKAANALGEVLKGRGEGSPSSSSRAQEKFVGGFGAAVDQVVEQVKPAVDEAWEAERRKELEELRAKVVEIEHWKKENEEKFAGLNKENAVLVNDKRNLREKVMMYENEILSLRETLQNSRKDWVEMNAELMSMKRRLAEHQEKELESQKEAAYRNRVEREKREEKAETEKKEEKEEKREKLHSREKKERKERQEQRLHKEKSEGRGEYRKEEYQLTKETQGAEIKQNEGDEVEEKEQNLSRGDGSPQSSNSAAGLDHIVKEEATLQALEGYSVLGKGDQSLDLNLELSASIPIPEKRENKSKDFAQAGSDNFTLMNLNQKDQKVQGPNVPPINGGNLEKTKEQTNTSHHGGSNSNRATHKEIASPKNNIQVRSPKKASTFIKPSQVHKAKKDSIGQKTVMQQNQSMERITDKNRAQAAGHPVYQQVSAVAQSYQHVKSREDSRSAQAKPEDAENSIEGDVTARKKAGPSEFKTQRVGTANQTQNQHQTNVDFGRERQELRSAGQPMRNTGALSPRSIRTKEVNVGHGHTNAILGPVFKSRPEFTGGVVIKGFKEGKSPEFIQSARQTQPLQHVYELGGNAQYRDVVQSVLEIQDEYRGRIDYSPKGELRKHYEMFDKGNSRRDQVVAMNKFGVVINSSNKAVKRNSLQGLDDARGASTERDEVVHKVNHHFSPVNGFNYDASERMASEPSRIPMTYKKNGHDMYADSPRNFQANVASPKSPYYYIDDNLIEVRLSKNSPMARTFKVKLTIDECIRQAVAKDSKEPAATKEEAQMRVMYRAMLTKAKQQPKISAWMRKAVQESGYNFSEDHPVVEYEAFEGYVNNMIQSHAGCGENCVHLRDFYARIGYLTSWNNREIMSVKRTQIGSPTIDWLAMSPKFPNIKKKKKEADKEVA